MASEILMKIGTPITAAVTSLVSLGTTTSSGGCQSAKIDLGAGAATLAQQYLVRLATRFTTAPTAGGAVEVYVGFSSAAATNSGNAAGLTGADAAYTGYATDVAVSKRQLTFVGVLSASSHTSAQIADVGTFMPLDRYAQIVVVNTASQAMSSHTDSHSVSVIPLKDEAQ